MNKTSIRARRGSALLIVLGMISFMVISAVAFSAYMRYSRLPSSYLRRSSSSRHLAHAAMAEAIDRLDVAIGDNPHPGFGERSSRYPRAAGYVDKRNYWRDRCFIGTNQLVEAEDTASTLTLEALAYIPPSLLSEARYYSRHAESARWTDLGYDSGRYAFFALDVSDCLNINRVPANWARNSSDLGKLSLACAFEDTTHSSYTVKPSAWDTFMDAYVDFDKIMDGKGANKSATKMPLVSLADLNLAAYAKAGPLAQYVSPFCNYLMSGANIDDPESLPGQEILRSLNILTDSYYPPMAVTGGDEADIYNPEHQPFTRVDEGETQPPNREVLSRIRTDGIGGILSRELPSLDLINLYDYLDENDIPTSLALPTTERVPMLCGLQSALKLRLEPTAEKTDSTDRTQVDDGKTFEEVTTCKLKVQGVGALTGLWMFPFRRDHDIPSTGYPVEMAVRICFATEAPGLRTRSESRYVLQQDGDFKANGAGNSTLMPKVQTTTLSFSNVDQPESAFQQKDLTIDLAPCTSWLNGQSLLTVRRTIKVHVDPETNARTYEEVERTAEINPDFRPVSANGADVDNTLTVDMVKNGQGLTVRPYMSITARVKCPDGETVDLVPAAPADDNKYNSINTDPIGNIGGGSSSHPVIVFAGDKDLNWGVEVSDTAATFLGGQPIDVIIQPSTGGGYLMCPDPRWNFAPENFLLKTGGSLDQSAFLNELNSSFLGKQGRDGDIFMFVSNQGYLQSISELAFLPRTARTFGGGNDTGECAFTFDRTGFETDVTKLPHYNLMWRTYRLWAQDGEPSDGLYDLGVFDGGRGPRVNPYTSSQQVILSALANTPYSWWAASTNYNAVGKSGVPDDDAEAFNKKYAFSAMNSKAKFDWEDLKLVAESLQSAMRADVDGDWVSGWENLDWGGGKNNNNIDLAGVQFNGSTVDFYDVDRKFLYGYWRDCFAAKQQLFLVFVRAEPLMMGGGVAGRTPPQLGARAMALVWRNPAPGSAGNVVGGLAAKSARFATKGSQSSASNNQDNVPHRTRVLFYRQFE